MQAGIHATLLKLENLQVIKGCVKNIQIRSYFWSEYRKILTRNNSLLGHFSHSGSYRKHDKIFRKRRRQFQQNCFVHIGRRFVLCQ